MSTNDYDVIVFKLLVYYYACLKHTTVFKQSEFDLITKKAGVNEEYLLYVLEMMQDEGLIKGLTFTKALLQVLEWCINLVGTFRYPDEVPADVWRRHRRYT